MIEKLLQRRGLSHPDGRPLFAYRLTDDEYQELCQSLVDCTAVQDWRTRNFFCLFVAEWYRREFDGGAFSWERPLAALKLTRVEYYHCVAWTESGLEYWQRKLRRSVSGDRMFLFSLIAEGGFPLRLLQDVNRFRQFFLEMLQTVSGWPVAQLRAETEDGADLEGLARPYAYLIPKSLRTREMLLLGAELVVKLWASRVAAGPRPADRSWIAHLDVRQPNWRDKLPIEVDDAAASALLNQLLIAGDQMVGAGGRRSIRWALAAVVQRGEVEFRRELRVPHGLTTAHLKDVLNDAEPTGAMRVSARTAKEERGTMLGDVVRSRTARAGEWYFDRNPSAAYLKGPLALAHLALRVEFDDLTRSEAWGLPGAEGPDDDQPWAFWLVEDGPERTVLEWAGGANLRNKRQELWVCLPSNTDVKGEHFEPLAWRSGLVPDRIWVRTTSDLTVSSGATTWRIRLNVANTDEVEYTLFGAQFFHDVSDRVVYLGMPRVLQVGNVTTTIPIAQLQTRMLDGSWRPALQQDWGNLVLRHVEQGETRFATRILVVPSDLRVRPVWPNHGVMGAWHLTSAALQSVRAIASATPPEQTGNEWRVAWPAGRLAPGVIELRGDAGQTASVTLVAPAVQISVFSADGTHLNTDATIHIANLSGYTVRWQGPDPALISATLWRAPPVGDGECLDGRTWSIFGPPSHGGTSELNLGALSRRIKRWLATTDELDVELRLCFEWQGSPGRFRLRVRRYDWALRPIDGSAGFALEGDADAAIVEAIKLTTPSMSPVELHRNADGAWHFPAEALPEPGTWLLTVREGDWYRGRPLARYIRHEKPAKVSEAIETFEVQPDAQPREPDLATAVESNNSERPDAIQAALGRLQDDLNAADWRLLEGYVALTRDLPGAALDVIRQVRRLPELAAMALFRLGGERAKCLHAALDDMGFVWEALPVPVWVRAMRAYQAYCVGAVPQGFQALAQDEVRATIRRVYGLVPTVQLAALRFAAISGLTLAELGLDANFALVGLPQAQAAFQHARLIARQELLGAHAESRWPNVNLAATPFAPGSRAALALATLTQGLQTVVHGYQLDTVRAPAMIAVAARFAAEVDAETLIQVRTCRDFAPEFFESDLRYCLCLLPPLDAHEDLPL